MEEIKEEPLLYRFHDPRHSFASYHTSSGKVDILTLTDQFTMP
ncbi:MAG: hypothetical protein PVI90_16190 [Desulfobacteraceae bacterium]|jgi:hypothetical protein